MKERCWKSSPSAYAPRPLGVTLPQSSQFGRRVRLDHSRSGALPPVLDERNSPAAEVHTGRAPHAPARPGLANQPMKVSAAEVRISFRHDRQESRGRGVFSHRQLSANFTIEQRATGDAATTPGPNGTGMAPRGRTGTGVGPTTDLAPAPSAPPPARLPHRGADISAVRSPVVANVNLFRARDVANVQVAEATIRERRQLLLDLQATVLLNVGRFTTRCCDQSIR